LRRQPPNVQWNAAGALWGLALCGDSQVSIARAPSLTGAAAGVCLSALRCRRFAAVLSILARLATRSLLREPSLHWCGCFASAPLQLTCKWAAAATSLLAVNADNGSRSLLPGHHSTGSALGPALTTANGMHHGHFGHLLATTLKTPPFSLQQPVQTCCRRWRPGYQQRCRPRRPRNISLVADKRAGVRLGRRRSSAGAVVAGYAWVSGKHGKVDVKGRHFREHQQHPGARNLVLEPPARAVLFDMKTTSL
jgi:hypothetical protein